MVWIIVFDNLLRMGLVFLRALYWGTGSNLQKNCKCFGALKVADNEELIQEVDPDDCLVVNFCICLLMKKISCSSHPSSCTTSESFVGGEF